jgi:hypothetical protein
MYGLIRASQRNRLHQSGDLVTRRSGHKCTLATDEVAVGKQCVDDC